MILIQLYYNFYKIILNSENNFKYSSYHNMQSIDDKYKCPECGQKVNTVYKYCRPCNSAHFCDNFTQWTSGSSNIDELIQNSQLNASNRFKLIEWIDYSNLKNVELVAHGGFGNVYKAIWKDGPINRFNSWNIEKSEWKRESNKKVAIKKFRNATSVSPEFLNEVNNPNNYFINKVKYLH